MRHTHTCTFCYIQETYLNIKEDITSEKKDRKRYSKEMDLGSKLI